MVHALASAYVLGRPRDVIVHEKSILVVRHAIHLASRPSSILLDGGQHVIDSSPKVPVTLEDGHYRTEALTSQFKSTTKQFRYEATLPYCVYLRHRLRRSL